MGNIKEYVIGGIIFYLEESVYPRLERFLNHLTLGSDREKRELESKVAEILLFRLKNGSSYTTLQDIQFLTANFHTFFSSLQEVNPGPSSTLQKKHYRPFSFLPSLLELA